MGDYLVVGTVVEANLSIEGKRQLKPMEELNPDELEERIRMEDAYHDFEFEEDLK
ncbi:MAG: hypothetical protein HY426_03445 [Candidatus Levybacteria bacterium]|nr:hypothetical protein [Candidatus Levybacteria bacterium]